MHVVMVTREGDSGVVHQTLDSTTEGLSDLSAIRPVSERRNEDGIVSDELNVWMHDATDHAEVAIAGPVTAKNAWRLWRTLEAACAMYSQVTIDLATAAAIDPLVLADLLATRDRLAAHDRALTLVGIVSADPNTADVHTRGGPPRRTQPSPRRRGRAHSVAPTHHPGRGWRADQGRAAVTLKRGVGETPDMRRDGRLVAQVTARLSERYPLLPRDMVEQVVRHYYGSYGLAPIRDFIPILLEREVDDHFGDLVI